ncbi:hypothetical protein IPL85_02325 [Candidatus Saccharibacteria bacterium]|nr:MAG: hypothetical protein IPL85_02325 [Candidatus Saccharibacteria bacterium]
MQPNNSPILIGPNPQRKLLTIALVLAVLGVIGFFQVKSHLERTAINDSQLFYAALENNLSTTYVKREIRKSGEVSGGDVMAFTQTDVSDPAKPKSFLKTVSVTSGNEYTSERYLGTPVYPAYVRYSCEGCALPPNLSPVAGKWLQIKDMNEVFAFGGDDLGWAQYEINTSLSRYIMGNFSSDDRKAILQAYRDKKVFVVPSTAQTVDIDGHKVKAYTNVQTDWKSLQAVNDLAAKRTKQEMRGIGNSGYDITLSFYIDQSTKRFVRVEEKSSTSNLYSETVDYSYPTQLTILPPSQYEHASAYIK